MLPPLLTLLAATAVAAPGPEAQPHDPSKPRTFAIKQAPTDEHHPDPAARLAWLRDEGLRARMKHAHFVGLDREKVEAQRRALEKRADVQVKNWGSSYSIQVDIGTPPQSFDTFIDTGSSDLWVVSDCLDPSECGMSEPFVPAQSTTYRNTQRRFEIKYLKGETTGVWGEDIVSVGSEGHRSAFGVANNVTEWATEQSALMGLAFGSASTDLNTPWWEEQSKNWTDRRFGLYLARTQNWTDAVYNPNPQGGSLTLGGVDTSKFYGEASYYPLLGRSGLWNVPSQGVTLNGRLITTRPVSATTDSGTSIIMGPDADVRAFYQRLDPNAIAFSDGSFAFECGPGGSINASFAFGDAGTSRQFTMWDGDLVYFSATPAEYAAAGARLPRTATGERYCIGNIMGWNDPRVTDNWLIGSPFLRNVYSIYRVSPPSHGLAPLSADADLRYGSSYDPTAAPGDTHNPNNPDTAGSGNATTVGGSGGTGGSAAGSGGGTAVGGGVPGAQSGAGVLGIGAGWAFGVVVALATGSLGVVPGVWR